MDVEREFLIGQMNVDDFAPDFVARSHGHVLGHSVENLNSLCRANSLHDGSAW